ncbi:MAG: glycoside hydrolase family 5 protein, partial [Lachnospiraceae bacterium]|nr:glycoside hydrolase family 5 protein [Lachnospiraceae bacterium]
MRTKKKTKTHNRILALALSLCLMLGLVPTGFIPTGLLPAGVETDFKIEAQAAEAPDPTAIYNSSWQAPYEKYGELQLKIDPADGIKKLHAAEDKGGQPVQLKGMSTFGMMFDNNGNSNEFKAEGAWILTPEVFDIMAYDWQVDFIRIAMYVTEGGTGVYAQLYNTLNGVTGGYPITGTYEPKGRPDIALRRVIKAMDLAIERGLYVMVDWHVLNPGDPSNPDYLNAATWMTGDASATFEYPDEKTVGVDWTSTGDGLEGVSPGIDISDFPTWRRNQTAPSKRTMNGPQLFFSYLANRYYAATGSITTNSSGVITGNNRQTTPRDAEATQLRGSQALKGQGQIIWEIANEPNTRDWNIEQHSRAAAQGGCNHPNTIRNGASITFGHSMNYGWQNIQACNWEYRLLPYMNGVTSTIRYFDQNGIIIAGTDNWCQYVDAPVMANKFVTDIRNTKTGITDPRDEDYRVMYTMHFYAGTHDVGDVYDSRNGRLSYPDADGNNGYGTSYNDYAALGPAPAGTTGAYWLRQKIDNALAGGMAIFCTEWGVSGASGDFGPYLEFSERWLDYLAKKGISWSAWSLARKNETSSVTKFNTPNGTGTSPFPNAFTGANAQRRDESLGGATYGIPYWTDVQVSDAGRYIRAKLRGESDALAKTRSGDIRFKKADSEKGSFVSLPFTFDNGKGREGWSSEGNLLESSDMTIANVAPAGQPENMALKVSL